MGIFMACVEASSLYFGHWGEGSDGKTGNGLAGKYLPSEGKWPVGLGHDHFAIAVNYGRPNLILGGPSGNSCVYPSRMCCELIWLELTEPLVKELLDPLFCHFGY